MSETTHVFWVKSDLVPAWEEELKALDPDAVEGIQKANKKKSLVERVEALEA
jgi:hypothetical protein